MDPTRNLAIGSLRVLVWLMPVSLPFAVVWAFKFAPIFVGWIAAVVALLELFFLGYFDALLGCQQRRIDPGSVQKENLVHAGHFACRQFFLVPLLLFVITIIVGLLS